MDKYHESSRGLNQIQAIQEKLIEYVDDFEHRSGGFELPSISYLGSLSNPVALKSKFLMAIPIKNQEEGILDVLDSLLGSISLPSSLGIIFDNCTDNSQELTVQYFLEKFNSYHLLNAVHLFSSCGELFETTCENIIFSLEEAEFNLSLQADIHLNDPSFQQRALTAFNKIDNLLALSGRAIVGFEPSQMPFKFSSLALLPFRIFNWVSKVATGRLFLYGLRFSSFYFGDISEFGVSKMNFLKNQENTVYLGEATIRGPLVWRGSFFRKLGGLDDVGYYLGRDDCDLSWRGWVECKWRSGYLPCRSYSIPSAGTTRKSRTPETLRQMKMREDLSQKNMGELMKYWKTNTADRISVPAPQKVKISK